jgi:Sap, sulfolipid-1-addressing protein
MTEVLLSLLPVIICIALMPTWILLALLLLQSHRGVACSVAFIAGVTIMHFPLALICGALFGDMPRFGARLFASPVLKLLFTIAGLALLITAAYTALHDTDPQAPPHRWLDALDKLSPAAAFGMGLLMVFSSARVWLGVLLALALIGAAPLDTPEQLLAFVVFTLASEVFLILPLVVRLLAPERSGALLATWTAWLTKNSRVLMIGASVVFGVFFLWSGLTG